MRCFATLGIEMQTPVIGPTMLRPSNVLQSTLFSGLLTTRFLMGRGGECMWIRGDLISMSKVIHDISDFPMEFTFTHPTRTGLCGHARDV